MSIATYHAYLMQPLDVPAAPHEIESTARVARQAAETRVGGTVARMLETEMCRGLRALAAMRLDVKAES
jgi:hypothetical protein